MVITLFQNASMHLVKNRRVNLKDKNKQVEERKKERKKEVFVLRAALNTKHKSSMPRTNVVKSTRISYSGTKKNAEKITHK